MPRSPHASPTEHTTPSEPKAQLSPHATSTKGGPLINDNIRHHPYIQPPPAELPEATPHPPREERPPPAFPSPTLLPPTLLSAALRCACWTFALPIIHLLTERVTPDMPQPTHCWRPPKQRIHTMKAPRLTRTPNVPQVAKHEPPQQREPTALFPIPAAHRSP